MKDLKKIINLTCGAIICFLLLSQAESKAQVKEMSAEELTNESTAVLYGKCSKIKCEWNETKDIIFTYVKVVPEEYIKGNLGSEVVIAVPGGRVDDIIYEVSEMPVFTEGEEIVAFIWRHPSGRNLITGGYLGKMRIEKDKKTGKRMVNWTGPDTEAEVQNQGLGKAKKPEKVRLEDFITRLKGYIKH